jgi:hypothetical protein
LRDAGGFLFDLYRFGEQREILVRAKLEALIATDKEIHSLEAQLGVGDRVHEIRQPGVGGRCPSCGAFHASAAKFCERCGAEVGAVPAAAEAHPAAETAEEPVAEAIEEPVVEAVAQPVVEEQAVEEMPAEASPVEEQPAAEEAAEIEPVAEEPAALPEEPDGEVTIVRQADEESTAVQTPASNGPVPAAEGEWPEPEHAESANGEAPAPETADPEAVDPGTGEIAAVGRTDGPRTRRSRARRRRGTER